MIITSYGARKKITEGMYDVLNQLKTNNLRSVLQNMLIDKQAAKQTLVQQTGLSNTTISDSINSMLKLGLIVTCGNEKSNGGRRSVIYQMNEHYGQFIGIELSAKELNLTITDTLGNKLLFRKFERRADELPIYLLRHSIQSVWGKEPLSNPLAIAIGINGLINYREQIVIKSSELNWENVHLKELVERWFYIPTFIDSSPNGLIFLENYIYHPREAENFMVLCEDFPQKISICMNGEIMRGKYNICGKTDDFDTALEKSEQLAEFMDIQRVVIRYRSPKYEKLIQDIPRDKSKVEFMNMPCEGGELSYGLALMAEILWFESIYFLLQL